MEIATGNAVKRLTFIYICYIGIKPANYLSRQ